VTFEETQAVLAAPALLAGERKRKAAFALAELLSRRGLERACELLIAWAGRPGEAQHAALELCLLIREKEPARYTRAALRWHGRYCREVDVTFEEAQAFSRPWLF
jgi:hypothetical protein